MLSGVHSYRGIENWKDFIDLEFVDTKPIYTTLKKTYRTTTEIMNIANSVISHLPAHEKEYIVLGEPIIHNKNSISISQKQNINEIISEIITKINQYTSERYKSIAIIGKTQDECIMLYNKLKKLNNNINLIKSKDSEYNAGISIVPSYLAKGLEFDVVIISNANTNSYTNSSLDIKLLYVAITRAMNKLDIYYTGELTNLLL